MISEISSTGMAAPYNGPNGRLIHFSKHMSPCIIGPQNSLEISWQD